MDEEERKEFDSWLDEVKTKRMALLDKRSARHLRKQQLTKRRTAASQERMRMISQLAKMSKKDDTFGQNDDDWDVYKKIRKDTGDSDSEEEQERLAEFEAVLREHDPAFQNEDENNEEITRDSPEWYQLHLATERIRVPEIYFQPSIIGSDQAGISESLEFILNKYDEETSAQLASNVFLTGAAVKLTGLVQRVADELISVRPFKSLSKVAAASNPTLDPFKGMQDFSQDFLQEEQVWISKAEYEEKGSDLLKIHCCSNQG
jgi:actin-related protein 5